MRPGSKRLLREMNRHRVLQLVVDRGPISRTELARDSGLTASTITHIAADFVLAGLVTEVASTEGGIGRHPVMLDLDPSAGYLVGVKLRDDDMTVAVCDLRCEILFSCEASVPPDALPGEAVTVVARNVEDAIAAAGIDRQLVLGVGLGVPGIADSERRWIVFSHARKWRDVNFGRMVEDSLGVPVWIDNVVNTLAIGQRRFGDVCDSTDFLLVTIGRGIGMSAVIGGQLHRGNRGAASDLGHVTVDSSPYAPPCNCGKRGCLEAFASDYGIVRAAIGRDPGPSVERFIEQIVEDARGGDPRLRALFERAGEVLGVAIANLYNLYDPDRVILAGEGLRAQDLFLDKLQSTVPLHTPGHRPVDIHVDVLPVDDVAWARGAAALVLDELLRAPVYEADRPSLFDRLAVVASARSSMGA